MINRVNKEYWGKELLPPLSPSVDDLEIYKKHLTNGKTLLLGCTHKLIKISDSQLDIDPWYESSTVIKGDWRDNTIFYENIIGDGVLNFSRDLTDEVLKMSEKYSTRLIVRCFNYKLPQMKIADYFPLNDFIINPDISISFEAYSFYIWNFDHDRK